MNRMLLYIIGILLWAYLGVSCNKEGIIFYDPGRPGVEFDNRSAAYSFKKAGKTVDTVAIPFSIVGYPEQRVRQVNFLVVTDSTTAKPEQYRILGATVPPGEYKGLLNVYVENTLGEDFPEIRLYLRIAENEDFVPGLDDHKDCVLRITNSLIRPQSWTLWSERYFLGTYSTAYYQFIIGATGETEFPYPDAVPGYNNGEKWNSGERKAFLDKLKSELKERNKMEDRPLLHDDGPAKGKEVIVGHYYEN